MNGERSWFGAAKGFGVLSKSVKDLFRLPAATRQDQAVEDWFEGQRDPLGIIAKEWFDAMHHQATDVCVTLHDGFPTACIGDAAFAYVARFRGHVNVGFFRGATLSDPNRVLEGTGKLMRHVKIRVGVPVDQAAVRALIVAAYWDLKRRLGK